MRSQTFEPTSPSLSATIVKKDVEMYLNGEKVISKTFCGPREFAG